MIMSGDAKRQDYLHFLKLVGDFPGGLDMFYSPDPDDLSEFYEQILNSNYCKNNLKRNYFESATEELEKLYLETKVKLSEKCFDENDPLSVACRKERKARLLVRLLYLLGDTESKKVVDMDLQRRDKVKLLQKSITNAKIILTSLMNDEIFLETLNSEKEHRILNNLLEENFEWLNDSIDVSNPYVFKRAKKENSEESTEITRYLCDRLSDATYRLYGDCSNNVMKNLLRAIELPEIRIRKIEEIIKKALEVKIERYLKQETQENMKAWNQDELWRYAKGFWSPQRSLVAPWFRA